MAKMPTRPPPGAEKPNPPPAPPRKNDGYTVIMWPDWGRKCEVCKASPIVPVTGMCGPCTFGEADTADGNW